MSESAGFPTERSFLYGFIFSCVIYGIDIYMYIHSLSIHLSHSQKALRRSTDRTYIILGGLMLILLTIAMVTNLVSLDFMWIAHRDFEGGPLAYLSLISSSWWLVFGTVADQITYFIADGLLIYRCYIIWNSRWPVIVIPTATYLTSVAMALILAVETAQPGTYFFKGSQVNFGVLWAAFSVTTNVLVTALISFQIIHTRQQFQHALESVVDSVDSIQVQSVQIYTGPVAILVESALPYTITGLVWAVVYGKNLVAGPALTFIWGTISAVAPQLIIFRVASGRAWNTETMSMISSLAFAQHGSNSCHDGNAPIIDIGLMQIEDAGSNSNEHHRLHKNITAV